MPRPGGDGVAIEESSAVDSPVVFAVALGPPQTLGEQRMPGLFGGIDETPQSRGRNRRRGGDEIHSLEHRLADFLAQIDEACADRPPVTKAIAGGAVYNGSSVLQLSLSDCTFNGNQAIGTNGNDGGGAVYCDAVLFVTNCQFLANQATPFASVSATSGRKISVATRAPSMT